MRSRYDEGMLDARRQQDEARARAVGAVRALALGDGAYVRPLYRSGHHVIGDDDRAQQQAALQLAQAGRERCEVAGAGTRVQHGAQRDLRRRLPDVRDELGR